MQAFGFIYITTNLINGKRYIGQSSYNSNKKGFYLGSGKHLLKAIKKYGKENFKRDIICSAFTREDLSILETQFIAEYNAVEDPMFYNLAAGGYATRGFAGKQHSAEFKAKQAENGRKRPVTENMMAAFRNSKGGFSGTEKHRLALIKNGKANTGRKKYNNGLETFFLFPDDPKILELNLVPGIIKPDSWGKKLIGKKWFNDGIKNFFIFPDDNKIDELLLKPGLLSTPNHNRTKTTGSTGRKWFNNGHDNFLLFESDPTITKLNLKKGMLKSFTA